MIDRREALGTLAALGVAALGIAVAAGDVAGLLRRETQALMDAITAGDAAVWDRLLAPDFVLTDEGGQLRGKPEVVGGMKPHGSRIWGKIRVQDFVARVSGDVAVTTYLSDEDEGYFGHVIHCQYRSTDTWRRSPRGWTVVASQVLALRTEPPAIALPAELLRDVAGSYALAPKTMRIEFADGALTVVEPGRASRAFKPEARDVFSAAGQPPYRYLVERSSGGAVSAIVQRREAWDLRWARTASLS